MSREDRLSVSVSNFQGGAKVFWFVPLGKGYLVRVPSWVAVWSHGQVSLFSRDPQDSPQVLLFGIGAFDYFCPCAYCSVVWEGLCGSFSLQVLSPLSSLKLCMNKHNPNVAVLWAKMIFTNLWMCEAQIYLQGATEMRQKEPGLGWERRQSWSLWLPHLLTCISSLPLADKVRWSCSSYDTN